MTDGAIKGTAEDFEAIMKADADETKHFHEEFSEMFEKYGKQAVKTKIKFDTLVAVGFTHDQALELCTKSLVS